jgi:hypothetical protein
LRFRSLGMISMETPEARAHSFIVKLWLEETGDERTGWHGSITHVPSGERHYLRALGDILTFIRPYVEATEFDDGSKLPQGTRGNH